MRGVDVREGSLSVVGGLWRGTRGMMLISLGVRMVGGGRITGSFVENGFGHFDDCFNVQNFAIIGDVG